MIFMQLSLLIESSIHFTVKFKLQFAYDRGRCLRTFYIYDATA